MAYTSVRANFEIGHEAKLRAKKTVLGFTHDWELFFRGADNTDIQHFVEKVVFILHHSFEKPKRVLKEPPYVIQESGYAGFTVLVDVHLRNKPGSDPTKIHFEYNLALPAYDAPPLTTLSNLVKETYIFNNPTEDFRRKLIKGGGVGVGASSASHSSHMSSMNSSHTSDDQKTSVSKSRPSPQDAVRKSKKENSSKQEDRLHPDDEFALFGVPILKKEIPYATASKNSKSAPEKSSQPSDQKLTTHASKSSKYNSSSHKEKERDKEKEREKEKPAEKQKEREKDKNTGSLKRSSKDADSGVPAKKVKKEEKDKASKSSSSSSSKDDSKMKSAYHEENKKEKEKSVEKPAATADKESSKADKKDKEKKHKDDKKVKSKEKYKNDKKESASAHESYADRAEKSTPVTKEEAVVVVKEEKKAHEKEEKQTSKDKSLYGNETTTSVTSSAAASSLKDDKHKHHKHKKEKSKKEAKRDKEEKKEKLKEVKVESKERTPVQIELPPKAASKPAAERKPLNALFDELSDKSDSNSSSDDDMSVPQTLRDSGSANSSPELTQSAVVRTTDASAYSRQTVEPAAKDDGRRKNKKSNDDKEAKKRKRKSKHRDDSPSPVKMTKFNDHRGAEENRAHNGLGGVLQTSVSPIPDPKFTDAYISKLKVLQEKIMTLDDNSGLQRIVQVVAETGQYEITTKTFDFDLCSLDEKIVDRLLDFF